jgi:hypothetical protein
MISVMVIARFGELYEHRAALISSASAQAWMSRQHHDGSTIDGYFIAGIDLPTSQISYHLPLAWWDVCQVSGAVVQEQAPEWDNHTSDDVINRLILWASQPD